MRLSPRCVVPWLAALLVASGCHLLENRPLTVLVRDAETGKPVPGAEVSLLDGCMYVAPVLHDTCQGTTGQDGTVRFFPDPYENDQVQVAARADGYLSHARRLPREAARGHVTVDIYVKPEPTVELVVPDGYRGVVKAEVHTLSRGQCRPGQRSFSFPVPANGIVEVYGPEFLLDFGYGDFHARYAGGAPLELDPADDRVGLREVTTVGADHYFVVGGPKEYEEARRTLCKHTEGDNWFGDEQAAAAWTARHRVMANDTPAR
jgi:hypothetical protein